MSGFNSTIPTPNKKGVWYKIYIHECPVCGGGGIERTRMPAPAPDDPDERYEYDQVYDYCDF